MDKLEKMEKMHEKSDCFKKSMMQTADLLVDSYKWKHLAECCEDANTREKYKHISSTLEELYREEHERIMQEYRAG